MILGYHYFRIHPYIKLQALTDSWNSYQGAAFLLGAVHGNQWILMDEKTKCFVSTIQRQQLNFVNMHTSKCCMFIKNLQSGHIPNYRSQWLLHKMLQKTALYACYIFDCQLSQWQVHQIIDRSPKKVENTTKKKNDKRTWPNKSYKSSPAPDSCSAVHGDQWCCGKRNTHGHGYDLIITWKGGWMNGWMDGARGSRFFSKLRAPSDGKYTYIYIYHMTWMNTLNMIWTVYSHLFWRK